ncbi:MAG TPA: ABC transporter permease, partial [Gemmatimonadaceae bacterium]
MIGELMRQGFWWDPMTSTVRYALRRMRRSPGFTLGVILSFALGIGANTAMFGIIDRLLLRPPAHVVDADRVRRLMVERLAPETGTHATVEMLSYPDYVAFTRARTFASVAAINTRPVTAGRGPAVRRYQAGVVTGNFFSLLGARSALGRFLGPDDDRVGAPGVAVLSYESWQGEFGGDRGVIGRTLDFGYGPYVIVGVAPKGFTGVDLRRIDVWLPLRPVAARTMGTVWATSPGMNWLRVVARLAPGVAAQTAEAEATLLHRQGRAEQIGRGRYDPAVRVVATPLIAARGPLASRESKVATWLAGISLLVLLIACANVANLLLARG